jgi:hypothetical protein
VALPRHRLLRRLRRRLPASPLDFAKPRPPQSAGTRAGVWGSASPHPFSFLTEDQANEKPLASAAFRVWDLPVFGAHGLLRRAGAFPWQVAVMIRKVSAAHQTWVACQRDCRASFAGLPTTVLFDESAGDNPAGQFCGRHFRKSLRWGITRSKNVGHEVHSLTGSVRPMDGV